MIRLVKNTEIDTKEWDLTIHLDRHALVYGLSWYLDIVSYGWDALIYDDYKAIMPLTPGKFRRVIPSLIRPYGTQQLGIFSREEVTPQLASEFLESIPARFIYKEICFNAGNPVCGLRKGSFIPRTNLIIPLSKATPESLRSRYTQNTRRNLAKASKYPHQVFYNDSPDVLISLFKNNKGRQLPHLTDKHYATLRQIMFVAMHKKAGYQLTLYDEFNTVIAGVFLLEYRGRVIFFFSACSDYGKQTHALTLLLDHILTQKAGLADIFDFEGSDIPGLRRFYEGFGAREEIYYQWRKWF